MQSDLSCKKRLLNVLYYGFVFVFIFIFLLLGKDHNIFIKNHLLGRDTVTMPVVPVFGKLETG